MIDFAKIRLAIRAKYGNEAKYAEEKEISKSKLSLILNNKIAMSFEFAEELIKDLDIPSSEIANIFFAK